MEVQISDGGAQITTLSDSVERVLLAKADGTQEWMKPSDAANEFKKIASSDYICEEYSNGYRGFFVGKIAIDKTGACKINIDILSSYPVLNCSSISAFFSMHSVNGFQFTLFKISGSIFPEIWIDVKSSIDVDVYAKSANSTRVAITDITILPTSANYIGTRDAYLADIPSTATKINYSN